MSFVDPNCRAIAAKAAKGKLTENEILDAFAKIDARDKEMRASGQTTGRQARIRKWAAEEGERAKIAAAAQKRMAALNVIVRQQVDQQVDGMVKAGLKPHHAMRALLEGINSPAPGSRASAAASVQAYEARYLGAMLADIERDKPHMRDIIHDEKLDADTLAEMWELRDGGKPGSTGNADAKYLAKKFADYAEMSRTDANRLGASIGKLDGWAGVQVHDDMKMIGAGKDAWVGFIVTKLDLERTFPEGLSSGEAARALGDIYDTIITGLPNKSSAAERGQRVNPANLAKSLGKSRVLHFRDAAAALDYRTEFGYGNTVSGMFSHLRHMAKIGGLMETLGPNPEVMFAGVADRMQRDIKASPHLADDDKQKLIDALKTDAGTLRQTLDVATGLASRPANVNAATIANNIRALQSMGKLGVAVVSSLGDTVTAASAAQFRGSGFMRGLMTQLGGVVRGRPRGEQAQIAYLSGEGFDGFLGFVASNALANDGPMGRMGALQEKFFKWSGLTWWTDVNRAVAGRTIAAELGMHSGTAFADLPVQFRHVLSQANISADEWGTLGKATMRLDNGKPYMTADRIAALSDADIEPLVAGRVAAMRAKGGADVEQRVATVIGDARRKLQIKLLSYVADQTSYAVIEADARTRRYTTQGLRPGTWAGEAVRLVMQFKGYPAGFLTRTFGRALFGQRRDASTLERAGHIGSLIAGLTIAGYGSMVMKDMLKGYWPPRDPTDPRTMLAAMQQGGALGIYGDFLFSKVNRFGGGITETLLGPSIGEAGDLANIVMDARDAGLSGGEDKFSASSAFSTIMGNVPFANLHLVKPALDFLIVNSIREALSPGQMQGQAKKRQKEYGQTRLGVPGAPPSLDPLNISKSF
jgi:hypothetical protein